VPERHPDNLCPGDAGDDRFKSRRGPVIEYMRGQSELLVVSSLTGKPFDEFPYSH
jgi:hypothetical protein